MFDWIHGLPLWTAKLGAVLLFAGVLATVWSLPKEFVYFGAPDRARWRDLRVWATVLLAVQCGIYYVF
ncbi:MAG: hypothetical protein AB2L13_03060 [Spirochaetota bacterium]|jgi:hypothetical protein